MHNHISVERYRLLARLDAVKAAIGSLEKIQSCQESHAQASVLQKILPFSHEPQDRPRLRLLKS
jgi:hypothetical protein